MKAKCDECGHKLVRCDMLGRADPTGGYWVCPLAVLEQSPEEFLKPFHRRAHQHAHIIEDHVHKLQRLAQETTHQQFLFGPDVGKRLKKAVT